MAGIKTSVALQDDFSEVMYRIIDSVNLGLSAMEDLYRDMESPVNTASIEGARDSLAQATIAAQGLSEALQGLGSVPAPAAPAQPTWQTDNLDVFSNTGIERFEQEIQSANTMMRTLNETQRQIGITAAQTDLFPDAALSDMSNMQVRLQAIQQRIQQIESNPMNMGTDAANSELEQLRGQLDRAVQEQEALNRAVQNMDVEEANQAYLRLSQTVSNTERYIRDNVDEQGQFNNAIEQGTQEANGLMGAIKGAVAAYATMQTVSNAANLSDQITSTTARLNLMNDGLQSTQEQFDMIYASALRTHAPLMETANAIATMGNNAGAAFNSNRELVAFMEQVNKHFAIGGASAQAQSNALLQLSQAMAVGALRGDELNSILEAAPGIARTIEKSMGWAEGSIRSYAEEGEVTAEVVKNSLLNMADETNAAFGNMPITFSQAMTDLQSAAIYAFQPVLQQMNAFANSEAFQSFTDRVISAVQITASVISGIFNAIAAVGSFIYQNWSMVSPIIYGIAAALSVWYTWQLLNAAATKVMTTAQAIFNAVAEANPVMQIVLAVIALIAVFYAAVAAYNKFTNSTVSGTGLIMGAIFTAGAVIGNVLVSIWNTGVYVFTSLHNLVADVANFLGNVFKDPVGAVVRLLAGLFDDVLNIAEGIAGILDTLFGSNFTATVSSFRGWINGMVTEKFGEGVEYVAKLDPTDLTHDRFSYSDAWNSGNALGASLAGKLSDVFSVDDITSGIDTNMSANLGDLTNALNNSDLADTSGRTAGSSADTADNTSDISKALDITNEDLKYLRDIAEREVVNRYTTASITVNMTNHNNISSDMDLDGISEYLRATIEDQMSAAAEGVH